MTGRILRLSPIALVLVAAACGGGGTKTVTVTTTVTRTVAAPHPVQARVYLVRDGKVAPVSRTVPSPDAAYLLLALVDGPNAAERDLGLTTAVPDRTGITPSSRLGLAQVVYTLSQFDPSRPVEFLGDAYTRADFEEQTPAILIESPLPFQTVTSPLHATGTADTFEATFQYELKDATGKVLANHVVTATSGSGIRGTFDVSIPFTVQSTQKGTLTVYEVSAKDGSRIHQVVVPLTLAP